MDTIQRIVKDHFFFFSGVVFWFGFFFGRFIDDLTREYIAQKDLHDHAIRQSRRVTPEDCQ